MTLALLAFPAAAGGFNPSGDGSEFNNADLTRDPANQCAECSAAPPYEWGEVPDLDWSLGLRGGVTTGGTDGPSYVLIALPSLTLRQETIRGGYDLGLRGEFSYKVDGQPRVDAIAATAGGSYRLDALTTLAGRADLTASQDDPDGPKFGLNVATAPLVVTGAGEASIARDFGPFNLALRGTVGREINGDTVFDDDTTADNSSDNTTSYGGGSRLGYALTPGLTAFVDLDARQEQYDKPSPSLSVKLDNVTYTGRGGLSARFGETFELEGSLGLGYRDFGDGTLPDFSAVLYDARAVFRPDETLALTAAFTTAISSPGAGSAGTARVTYATIGDVSYQVNPWLRLRADATWSEAHYQGTGTVETGWGGGVGADYLLNENTDLTADYGFRRTEKPPAAAADEHQVTVGITLHR